MIIESLCKEEGFSSVPYLDTEGVWTQGNGLKLPLSSEEYKAIFEYRTQNGFHRGLEIHKDESELIVKMRFESYFNELVRHKDYVVNLSNARLFALGHMIYQLGVPTALRFKNMWKAIEDGDFEQAGVEMLDSNWYRQMHRADMSDGVDEENRVEWLADIMVKNNIRERNI